MHYRCVWTTQEPSSVKLETSAPEKWSGGPPEYPYDQSAMPSHLKANDRNNLHAAYVPPTSNYEPNHYFPVQPPYDFPGGTQCRLQKKGGFLESGDES